MIAFDCEGLLNVAVGQPTLQSSIHPASLAFDLKGAVTGNPTSSFGFQTDVEQSPWWQVDLGCEIRLDTIVIYNRSDGFADKTSDTVVLISVEGERWVPVSRSTSLYGGAADRRPLVIFLGGERFCRYVRVERLGLACLSLADVQVWCRKSHVALARVFAAKGFSIARSEGAYAEASVLRAYDIKDCGDGDDKFTGVRICPFGRFGNNVIQMIHAVDFAKSYNLEFVDASELRLPDIFERSRTVKGNDVVLIFEEGVSSPTYRNKTVLRGNFWDLRFSCTETDRRREGSIIRHYLQQLVHQSESLGEKTVVLHIRSGDVFAHASPHPGYGQPPLSYYIKSIKDRQARYGVNTVVVVYEDEQNPAVAGLRKYVASVGLSSRFVSGALSSDIMTLMSAQHLVLSNGTFPLICGALSINLKTAMHFRDQSMLDWFDASGVVVDLVFDDDDLSFTAAGKWTGSRGQIELISTYSENLLSIRRKPERCL